MKKITIKNKYDIHPELALNFNGLSEKALKTQDQILKILLEKYYASKKASFN